MTKIKDTEKKVEYILSEIPETRKDDFILIAVFKDFYFKGYTMEQCMLNHNELGFPSFETITRCRRKIQAKYPELANSKVQEMRADREQDFKAYALS